MPDNGVRFYQIGFAACYWDRFTLEVRRIFVSRLTLLSNVEIDAGSVTHRHKYSCLCSILFLFLALEVIANVCSKVR